MNCFYHPDSPSVAACIDCGKGLCQPCTAKFSIAICNDCNAKRNQKDKVTMINILLKKILPSIVLFIVAFLFMHKTGSYSNIYVSIIFGYIVMSIPWGWSRTGDMLGRRRFSFLRSGFLDWCHWSLRISLSFLLGFVFFPLEVIKLIRAAKDSKKIDEAIERDPVNN